MAGWPRIAELSHLAAPEAGWRYLVALGSNVRHHRHGGPRGVLAAALVALERAGLVVEQSSRVIESAPLGPSARRYANGVAVLRSDLPPPGLLLRLKAVERDFGRRRGRRWGARVLDLDIVLWSGGRWCSKGLQVPHPAFAERSFVLIPAQEVAPRWRDPHTALSLRQLAARLARRQRSILPELR